MSDIPPGSTGEAARAGAGRSEPAAGGSAPSAAEQVKEVAQDARARGAELVSEAKDRAVSAAEAGKSGIAERIEDVAEAVHRSAEQLEGRQDWLAQLIERGADELGGLASTLRTNDLQGLIGKLDDLARRQPVVFVGAAMAAGFAAVRLGKAAASSGAGSGTTQSREAGP